MEQEELKDIGLRVHSAYYGLDMDNVESMARLHFALEDFFNFLDITESVGSRWNEDGAKRMFEKHKK